MRVMRRFFFDILGPQGETSDDVGQEFTDQTLAFEAAVSALTEVVRETSATPHVQCYWCKVRDSSGVAVFQCEIHVACSILAPEVKIHSWPRVSS